MRVLNDNVLVQVDASTGPRQSAGGLYLPETSSSESPIISGIVKDVGQGRLTNNGQLVVMNVEVGDEVFFPKYNASKVEMNGATYYVVSEQQILLVM